MLRSSDSSCSSCWPGRQPAPWRSRSPGPARHFRRRCTQSWADAYNKATGVRINYQSVGSGAGLRQIRGKTVDFGASDMPLTDEELAKDGLIQFPTVIGGVVPVVNVPGIQPGQLKLTGQVLGDIYLGKIAKWNDPAITALNPGLKLPDARLPWSAVPTVRARRSSSRTTCQRRMRSGSRRSARARRSTGRPARAARATRASPPSFNGCRTRSDTWSIPMPSRTSWRMR